MCITVHDSITNTITSTPKLHPVFNATNVHRGYLTRTGYNIRQQRFLPGAGEQHYLKKQHHYMTTYKMAAREAAQTHTIYTHVGRLVLSIIQYIHVRQRKEKEKKKSATLKLMIK